MATSLQPPPQTPPPITSNAPSNEPSKPSLTTITSNVDTITPSAPKPQTDNNNDNQNAQKVTNQTQIQPQLQQPPPASPPSPKQTPTAGLPASPIKEEEKQQITTNNNDNDNELEESTSLPPSRILDHKIIVSSSDGLRSNMLCPLEIFKQASNTNSPLIPSKYDPILVSTYIKNKSSSKNNKKSSKSSRKRKNDQDLKRSLKRRKIKPLNNINPNKIRITPNNNSTSIHGNIPNLISTDIAIADTFDDGDETEPDIDLNSHFKYDNNLNVNSRPKRKRKKVSYIEPDHNIIPVRRARARTATKLKLKIHKKVVINQQVQASAAVQSVPVVSGSLQPITSEKIVSMKWVQCDKCMKWRRIPTYIGSSELSGSWYCSMNKWDLKRASCLAEEEAYNETEETTVQVVNGINNDWGKKKFDFYNQLNKFYSSSNFMIQKKLNINQFDSKTIGEKIVDFFQLYLEVTKRGGYNYCIQTKLFDEIYGCLECFNNNYINDARKILPNLYAIYLIDYERKYYKNTFNVNQVKNNKTFNVNQVVSVRTS